MKLIGEDYEPLDVENPEDIKSKHIWFYSNKMKDFFLTDMFPWVAPVSDGYVIEIDGATTVVPEHFFVAVGDYDIGLDSIQFAEIMGREFDAFTISRNLEEDSWLLTSMKVVGYEENYRFYYPMFEYMFPVVVGDRAIIVSSKDMYNKIKRLSVGDFV